MPYARDYHMAGALHQQVLAIKHHQHVGQQA